MTQPTQREIQARKPVFGYEGLYEVSNRGRIINMSGKILKQCDHIHGYLQVSIRKDMKQKTHATHRLVLASFVKQPKGMIVNHKDGNKKNNTLSNLEWVTHGENVKHAMDSGLKALNGSDNPFSVLTDEAVRDIKKRAGTCKNVDLARKYGVNRTTIGRIINGKAWQHI